MAPTAPPVETDRENRIRAGRTGRSRSRALPISGIAAITFVGCSSSGTDGQVAEIDSKVIADDGAADGERNADGVLQLTAELVGEGPAEDPLCVPEAGRKVDEHRDRTVQAVIIPGAYQPELLLPDGRVMPAIDIPQITIPAHTIDGGCTVIHDAPAGCLGRVEVTGAAVPDIEIPGYEYRALDQSADRVKTIEVAPRVLRGAAVESQVAEQTCERGEDGSISRPTVQRPALERGHLHVSGEGISVRCTPVVFGETTTTVADSTCPDPLRLGGVTIHSLSLQRVTVPAETIDASELDSGATVLEEPDRTSYVAPAEVLFDTGLHELKAEATAPLREILAEIESMPGNRRIVVDGHTDDVGDEAANQALSERRAEAVAAWLRSEGVDGSRITVTGYGESVPAAPGTDDASRALNRRVVIGVEG